jgi:hypothetical protein
MKGLLSGIGVVAAGMLTGWWLLSLMTWVDDQNGYRPARIYKDRSAILDKAERELIEEFGFEPENEAAAELIASKDQVWSSQFLTCGETAPAESLYILRSIVWSQADKAAINDPSGKLTGVSDLTHVTRGQIGTSNPDCGRLQGDVVAFLVSERRLKDVFNGMSHEPTEPLPETLKRVDKTLLARTDAWLAARKIGEACTNLREPDYFQCGGTPGILFAYRAALLGSVYCAERKTDTASMVQLKDAWELAIMRSAAINKWHYRAALADALERLQAGTCSNLPFWLSSFEY